VAYSVGEYESLKEALTAMNDIRQVGSKIEHNKDIIRCGNIEIRKA
jgi:hypothetical protein